MTSGTATSCFLAHSKPRHSPGDEDKLTIASQGEQGQSQSYLHSTQGENNREHGCKKCLFGRCDKWSMWSEELRNQKL